MPTGSSSTSNYPETRSVVTIGNFDGVHLGHAALVQTARERANQHAQRTGQPTRVVVLAFEPHPASVLAPGREPDRLTSFDRRTTHLLALGADEVVRLEPTPELLSLTPAEFVDRVLLPYRPLCVVEGSDFHFGKARAGNVDVLTHLGKTQSDNNTFDVLVVPPVPAVLGDHAIVRASSTITRWLISNGRVDDAARVLGRWHELEGIVEKGDQRGRTIGFPTANIRTPCMVPADGVYAAVAHIPAPHQTTLDYTTPRLMPAAVSIGHKPTFVDGSFAVEAHLLDGPKSDDGQSPELAALPEYGWPIRIMFVSWIREQIQYNSLEPLLEQMERDCERSHGAIDALQAGSEVSSRI